METMRYEPHLDERAGQNYAGIRARVPIRKMKKVIPPALNELFGWLASRGIEPAGAPFVRFLLINMEALMEIEMCVPTTAPITGEGHINTGWLPAGRYAALTYRGVSNGFEANGALLNWGAQQGLTWDVRNLPEGDAFGGRFETYLTDPDDEPDQKKWQVEVAIRLADD